MTALQPTPFPRVNAALAELVAQVQACRLLYTLATGAVASKPAAARWAQGAMDASWHGLIMRAVAGKASDAATPETDVLATVALVEYAVEQFQPWATSLYNTAPK